MTLRVLVSGGGIAGPTFAWFLAQLGTYHITVVEKAPAMLPYGQNIDINGSAVTAMRRMGVLQKIIEANTTEKGTQFIGNDGKPFARLPLTKGSRASFTNELEILRGDMAKILYERGKDHPNIDYRFGTTVSEVLSNNENGVTVRLSNGETNNYSFLVAADGQWSKIRKANFPPENLTVVDKDMYVAYFTVPRLSHDNDWWNIHLALKSRIVSLRPDPHGTIRAMFSAMPLDRKHKQEWEAVSRGNRQSQEALIRRNFVDVGWEAPRLLDAMSDAGDYYVQAVKQIKLDKWSCGRIICLGDTAYAPTPLTGMGTSLAVIGAYCLAGELSQLAPGTHPASAFELYERTFRQFTEQIQAIPGFIPQIAHPDSAWKKSLAHGMISIVPLILRAMEYIPSFGREKKAETPEGNNDGFVLPTYSQLEEKLPVL